MEKIIKAVKFITNIITSIIIVVGSIFIILFISGIQPYVVESGSMEPTIQTGSLCFIDRRVKYDNMKVGDIIAFKLPDGLFATHRIYEITEEGFVTKGDKNTNVDSIVTTRDTYIGKNILSIPKCGFMVKKLQTLSGKIIMVTLILVFFVAGILLGEPSKKYNKKNKNKEDK